MPAIIVVNRILMVILSITLFKTWSLNKNRLYIFVITAPISFFAEPKIILLSFYGYDADGIATFLIFFNRHIRHRSKYTNRVFIL